MNKVLLFVGMFVIIVVGGFLIYQTLTSYGELLKGEEIPLAVGNGIPEKENVSDNNNDQPQQFITPMKALEGKTIAMVIAFKDFRDEEYFKPRQIFLAAGADVKTASNEKGKAMGADGGEVEVDFLVSEVNLAELDAVVFIGGPGALQYLDNDDSYKLAQETISQGKLLAAICIAPAILAKAGVLEGRKATVWTSSMDKSAVKILEDNGAMYQNEPVVADGKIITAIGPSVAEQFGMKVVEVLAE